MSDDSPIPEVIGNREILASQQPEAFHAYGLYKEGTEFVLDDFHRVENPRVMDDAYFEMVKQKYAKLSS